MEKNKQAQTNPEEQDQTREVAKEDTPTVTRRSFIQCATLAAGSELLLKGAFHPEAAYAAEVLMLGSIDTTPNRIANTPTFKYRPYRSKAVSSPNTTSWVQIDLGAPHRIEEIQLFPANQRGLPGHDAYYVGEGFPTRFKLERANDPGFQRAQLLLDHTESDFENPKDNIVSIGNLKGEGRYLRLTVTKFPSPQWTPSVVDAPEIIPPESAKTEHWFALSRIVVVANGADIAMGKHVTGDDLNSNPRDLQQLTRANRLDSEYVYRDRPDYVTDATTWRRVAYKAEAPRSGVTLHGGIFETTMRKNIAYLLESYTVNDLLLQFRERAGKPIPAGSKVKTKFWESDLAGSNAGRFLMGSGNTLRWIEDPELRKRFNEVIEGIAECKEPDGYCMAYPKDTIFYSERAAYTRAWLTHGLVEAGYEGNQLAFQLLRGYYNWFDKCEYLPNLMRGAVQGGQGMIANTRTYLTPVGKPADIQVIQRYFLEKGWLSALASLDKGQIWQYPYNRAHCYLLTNLEAYMDMYLATGDRNLYDGVKGGWELYHRHWQQAGGSISIIEFTYDPPNSNSLTQKLGENCGSSFWILLSQRFHLLAPDEEKYAAEIERSLYNVMLANQDGTYGIRYHTILVGHKEKGTRINTCCEGQGTRQLGSLPEHIYSVAPDGVYVNLFEPSTIAWRQNDQHASLRMDTRFPFEQQVKLTVTVERPTAMKLRVRVPSWATNEMRVSVNESASKVGRPGTYLELDRVWSSGDVVAFTLPMGFSLTEYKGVSQIPGKKRYSLTYGPFLYAAIGSKDAVLHVIGGSRAEDLIKQLYQKPGSPLHFSVRGNPDTVYMPYWQVNDEEFTCFPVVEA
jgi:hypothetical protein